MASPFSESHVALFLTVVCGAAARPDTAATAITTHVVIKRACRMALSSPGIARNASTPHSGSPFLLLVDDALLTELISRTKT